MRAPLTSRGQTRPCSDKAGGERGIALLLALLITVMISAIGLGMIYTSTTETSINGNYRDSQLAFCAMRAGLEETRDRMRTNSISPLTLPTAMPGSANSILYLTNPAGAGDTVDPQNTSNAYFDDEFCHESFAGVLLSNPGPNVACTAGPPSGSVAPYVNSFSPYTNTASALRYKWARVTLKQNATIPNATVDSAQAAGTQVCYQTLANQEIPLSLVPGGPYANCSAAQAAGQDASPVFIATSLAITPLGSRRMGQYEVAGLTTTPPPAALGLNGPSAIFSPRPSSNNYFINGNDSGASGYTSSGGTGSCVPSGPASVPAISTGDAAGATTITTALEVNPNRSGNYTGSGGTPSLVNAGPGGTGQFTGAWSSPSQLDNLVNSITNAADVSYSCGIGTPCSPSGPIGTNAAPQITFVNGDFNFGNGSGAGVLVVTGTLSFTGNASFNGLILVIGQGVVTESGGGNGGFNGTVFVAKTHSSTPPYPELTTLASPLFSWNGGGISFIQYNSCWANIGNKMVYSVVAMREEMY
jgi:PilX N-terminal